MSDVIAFSRYFVENDTNVVDIGCSTGKLTKALMEYNNDIAPNAQYVGVEIAEGFIKNLKDRKKEIGENVEFVFDDIRNYEFTNCSLVTSLFTLQFMPKKDRGDVIQKIYDGLNDGGGFLFSEKIDSENSRIQDMMTFNYYDYKRQFYSAEELLDKEQTLRHMMKPLTIDELDEMSRLAGFEIVETFWQNFNFVGMLCIKEADG